MESNNAQSATPQSILAVWSCQDCSVAFGDQQGLDRHLRIHAEQVEQARMAPPEAAWENPQMAPASAPASVAPSEDGSRRLSGSSTPTSDVNDNMGEEGEAVILIDHLIRRNDASWLDFRASSVRYRRADGQGSANTGPPEWPTRPEYTSLADSSARFNLHSLFEKPRIPPGDSEEHVELQPSILMLENLVNEYFLGWQKVQPLFHVATWQFNKVPMGLLGAMACIGSLMIGDSVTARQISRSCINKLNLMVQILPRGGGDLGYLASVCLHQVYLLGSDDPEIHKYVNQVRLFLTNTLLGRGLLGRSHMVEFPLFYNPSLQEAWRLFIKTEQENRVAWMVFEHDCIAGLIADQPHMVGPEHLPARLPCFDALWDAPNAEAWGIVQRRSPHGSQGPLLVDVLKDAVDHVPLQEHVSPWSKRLCAHIFERGLEDVVRGRSRKLSNMFGLGGVASPQEEITTILRAMGFLGKPSEAQTTLSILDLVNNTSINLMRRYNQLLTRPRTSDLIIRLARSAASPRLLRNGTSLGSMQRELIEQLAEHPFYSREYVLHAGQMIRMTKNIVVFTPSDCLRIFTAYLFVLAFTKYGPPSLNGAPTAESFRIDSWPLSDIDVNMWLQEGGPVQIGSRTGIQPGCCTKQVLKDAFKSLYRFKRWGVAAQFYNILTNFNDLDVTDE